MTRIDAGKNSDEAIRSTGESGPDSMDLGIGIGSGSRTKGLREELKEVPGQVIYIRGRATLFVIGRGALESFFPRVDTIGSRRREPIRMPNGAWNAEASRKGSRRIKKVYAGWITVDWQTWRGRSSNYVSGGHLDIFISLLSGLWMIFTGINWQMFETWLS